MTFSAFSACPVKFSIEKERSSFNWGDLCLPNLPNEIFVALISSGLNLCCTYFIGAVDSYTFLRSSVWIQNFKSNQ
jgi:hypothetical protein